MRIPIANITAVAAVVAIAAAASAEDPVTGPRRAARASDGDGTDETRTHLRTRASKGKTTTGAIDGGARGLKGRRKNRGGKAGKSGKGGGGGGVPPGCEICSFDDGCPEGKTCVYSQMLFGCCSA